MEVGSGYVLRGQIVSKGITLELVAGGTASSTTIDSGGTEIVTSGGSDIGANLDGNAILKVLSGGVASGDIVSSGDELIVASGGTAIDPRS